MIVNATKILIKANEKRYAIPQFNVNNLEWAKYILEECQSNHSPVILGLSEGAIKYMGGYNVAVNVITTLVEDLKIDSPVVIHLDHGSSVGNCIKAIDAGFTSVMIDASMYDLDTNIKMTKEVVEQAHLKDVSVEAEVGHIGGTEDNLSSELAYAKIDDAIELSKSGIDFIAPALGSVHGLYKSTPKLDFDRMLKIGEITKMPLVLHGGTGIPDDMIKKAILCGVSKININTELQIEWSKAVTEFIKNNPDVYDPRKIISSGEKALKEAVRTKIILLGSNNRV